MERIFSLVLASEIAIGVFVGFLSTFVVLFISHKLLNSKIFWSQNIRHVWLKKSHRPSYSVKVEKRGLFDLIETQVRCRLAVQDVLKNGGQLWNFYEVPTTFTQSLKWSNGYRIVHLNIRDSEVFQFEQYPYFVRNLVINRPDIGLRFEDFFCSYDHVYIQLFVVGHDRMTGIKKLYESPKYRFFQVRDGNWEYRSLKLEIDTKSKYA